MRRSVLVLSLVGALAIGVLAGTVLARSPSSTALGASSKCSKSSLSGSYAVRFEGQSNALGRFASVSLWRFDGKGRLNASETYNSEKTGPQKRRISGAYSVARSCVFQLRFGSELVKPHDAHGVCILSARGREFMCLDNEEGWITTGTGSKI